MMVVVSHGALGMIRGRLHKPLQNNDLANGFAKTNLSIRCHQTFSAVKPDATFQVMRVDGRVLSSGQRHRLACPPHVLHNVN